MSDKVISIVGWFFERVTVATKERKLEKLPDLIQEFCFQLQNEIPVRLVHTTKQIDTFYQGKEESVKNTDEFVIHAGPLSFEFYITAGLTTCHFEANIFGGKDADFGVHLVDEALGLKETLDLLQRETSGFLECLPYVFQREAT